MRRSFSCAHPYKHPYMPKPPALPPRILCTHAPSQPPPLLLPPDHPYAYNLQMHRPPMQVALCAAGSAPGGIVGSSAATAGGSNSASPM